MLLKLFKVSDEHVCVHFAIIRKKLCLNKEHAAQTCLSMSEHARALERRSSMLEQVRACSNHAQNHAQTTFPKIGMAFQD